jgi:hypothetical protein
MTVVSRFGWLADDIVILNHGKAKAFDRGAHDVSDEPRDESGKWTDGGGGGDGELSSEHEGAIRYYTEEGALNLNQSLREGTAGESEQRRASRLNAALDKLPNHQGNVIRYIADADGKLRAKYQPGQTIEERGFTSSSRKANFGGSGIFTPENSTKFVIASRTGKDISKWSHDPSEREVLFKSGTRFHITRVEGNTVHMEEA